MRALSGSRRGLVVIAAMLATAAGSVAAQQSPVPQSPGTVSSAPGLPPQTASPTPQQPGPRAPRRPDGPARDNAREPAEEVKGTGIIRGRVVSLDGGQPLRRATVRLVSPRSRGRSWSKRTDAEGRYEFRELPAADYQVVASKTGYTNVRYGQRSPREPGRPVQLADGQAAERIDLALPRGAVITGRVVDELGEPVQHANVALLQYRVMGGRRQLGQQNGATTNDLGVYRFFGLGPGDYYVSASARQFGAELADDEDTGYAPTFFPGTPSVNEAQRITVGIGEEIAADISLVPSRIVRITGIAVDSAGEPLNGGYIDLRPQGLAGGMGPGRMGGQVGRDGTFQVTGVTPGAYVLTANSRGTPGENSRSAPERGFVFLTVGGEDVTGVRVATSLGATLRGRITIEGATPASKPMVGLTCQAVDPEMTMMSGRMARVSEELTFELTNLYAPCLVRSMGSSASGLTLKAVLLNGSDVTDQPIDVSKERTTELVVVMTTRLTTLTGTAQGEGNRPVNDYEVLAFSTDTAHWGSVDFRRRSRGRADQTGQFSLRGLPPGEYHIIAAPSIEPDAEQNPDRLAQLAASASTVTLTEGSTQTVTLRLATPQ